jgi:hypothetical protein
MTLHIVFSPSAKGELRAALAEAGRDERVISLMDCLSFGPINSPDLAVREKWVEDELGVGWQEVLAESMSFWTEARVAPDRKIVWTSRRSAQEYAGFLELVWRLGDEPCEVVDLTDVDVVTRLRDGGSTKPHPAISLAMLHKYQILKGGLLDRAEFLTPVLRAWYRDQWQQLRTENAPLRVVTPQGLASAPLTFFDSLLLSQATAEWQKMALIVGKALSDFWDTSVIQTGDLVLVARVRALVEAFRLEARGDLFEIQQCEVRLPDTAGGEPLPLKH